MAETAEPLYPAQFSLVGTEEQGAILNRIHEINRQGKAHTVRMAVNALLGLDGNGKLKDGDTIESVAQRTAARLQPVPVDPASLVAP